MKEQFENIPLVKNDKQKRFEIEVDGHYAFINFGETGDQIALVHTEAESELRGTGAAAAVVEKTLHWLKENNKTVLPFCPYVFKYIQKNPEWKEVVDKSFVGYDQI